MSRAFLFCSLVILLIVCMPVLAAEPYVTGVYRPLSQGYLLQFTVYNTVDPQISMWTVFTADAYDPTGPQGWRIYQDHREVSWRANDIAYNIATGSSLSGFCLTSQAAPVQLRYSVTGFAGYSGFVTPQLVPEPSSLLAIGVGGIGVLGTVLRRRLRPKG